MPIEDEVREQVERLHEFFVGWIAGVLPKEDAVLEREFAAHLDADFAMVEPGGVTSTVGEVAGGIGEAHGSNPEFRIRIRNLNVRWQLGDVVCATYEEWQRNAKATTPPNNGRVSTVLFRRSEDGLVWLHVHETWLPAEVIASGDYEF